MKPRYHLTRRSLLASGLATASTAFFQHRSRAATTPARTACISQPPQLTAHPQRAVSLREISAALEAGRPASFEGLTRLDGFIVDRANRDLVLWGLTETGQSPLKIEDFIVALRAARGKYGEMRDGTNYVKNPAISIDPNPAIFKQFDTLKLLTPEGKARFDELCKSPQTVRVEGMPRNTRVAKVLIDADYRMKMVSQGMLTLPITSPFPADFNEQVKTWREGVREGRKELHHVTTRYWFHAGRFSYQASENADTVFLDRAQVVLSEEKQMFAGKSYKDSGMDDPVAQAFTCAWTERMDEIYKAEPLWRDMHNMFRHFAVARVIDDRDSLTAADFNTEFLLDRYTLPNESVPMSLPGLGRVDAYQDQGPSALNLAAYSVCGGVAVGFADPLEAGPATTETVNSGGSIRNSRPGNSSVSWTVTTSPGAVQAPAGSNPSQGLQDLLMGRPGIGGANAKPL